MTHIRKGSFLATELIATKPTSTELIATEPDHRGSAG
jgi:hypothetical protein